MNIEKAIELFVNCDTVTFTVTGCGEESYQTIEFENVVEALEKQAPKNAMGKGSTKEVGYCPNCKSHLMYEPKTNYCRWCGQRLSWEVEND